MPTHRKPLAAFFQAVGQRKDKEDDQPGDAVEERNSDFSEELEVRKGRDGDGEETEGGEPLEIFLPGGEVLFGNTHGNAQRDEAGDSEDKGSPKDVVAENDEQDAGNEEDEEAHDVIPNEGFFLPGPALPETEDEVGGGCAGQEKDDNIKDGGMGHLHSPFGGEQPP